MAKIVAYYDNLRAAEIEGQSDWGRVGAASLVRLVKAQSEPLLRTLCFP
jgi:hypothetical protein